MSLSSQNVGSLVSRVCLPSVSAANTAAATSGSAQWIDTQDLEGEIAVVVVTGAITGSVTVKVQTATDANGAGAADVTGAVGTAISTAAQTQVIPVPKTALTNRYLGIVGTVVTGPVLIGAVAVGATKYSG